MSAQHLAQRIALLTRPAARLHHPIIAVPPPPNKPLYLATPLTGSLEIDLFLFLATHLTVVRGRDFLGTAGEDKNAAMENSVQGSIDARSPMVAGVRFAGAASGRFYGLSLDHFSAYLEDGDALLSAEGVRAGPSSGLHLYPLRRTGLSRAPLILQSFHTEAHSCWCRYQLSAEHLPTDFQVQISNSSEVHLHSFKFESAGFLAHPTWGPPGGGLFSCRASSGVSIFGGSGNYGIMNATMAREIILADGCPDLRLSALVRKPQDGETPASNGALWIRSVSEVPRLGAASKDVAIEIGDEVPAVLAFSAAACAGTT